MLQLGFSVSFTVSVGASPSEHLHNLHNHGCARSSDPAVGIYASSMGQTLGEIRPELTENHHAAAGLFSVSFTVSLGCKSIGPPAHHTRIYMPALFRASCLHSCEQPESNSGDDPCRTG